MMIQKTKNINSEVLVDWPENNSSQFNRLDGLSLRGNKIMKKCHKCGSEVSDEYRLCTKCGASLTVVTEKCSQSKRYPALKTIAWLYKIFALFCAVIVAIMFLLSIINGGSAINGGAVALMVGGFICLTGFAAAEGIQVCVDIERNTRIN